MSSERIGGCGRGRAPAGPDLRRRPGPGGWVVQRLSDLFLLWAWDDAHLETPAWKSSYVVLAPVSQHCRANWQPAAIIRRASPFSAEREHPLPRVHAQRPPGARWDGWLAGWPSARQRGSARCSSHPTGAHMTTSPAGCMPTRTKQCFNTKCQPSNGTRSGLDAMELAGADLHSGE